LVFASIHFWAIAGCGSVAGFCASDNSDGQACRGEWNTRDTDDVLSRPPEEQQSHDVIVAPRLDRAAEK
jgi:hypothetical protein